jgi:hypothetical protein
MEIIHSSLSPTVLVFSNQQVDQICRKAQNSSQQDFGWIDLLQLSKSAGLDKIPVRTSSFTSLVIPYFSIHFASATSNSQDPPTSPSNVEFANVLDKAAGEITKNLDEWMIGLKNGGLAKWNLNNNGDGKDRGNNRIQENWRNRGLESEGV